MTYLGLNLVFMGVAFIFFLTQVRRSRWALFALTLLPMLLITAIFDNLIILSKIVAYDSSKISGFLIGLAPIEDFSYTVAAVFIVPTIWWSLGKRKP
jgi:lycopene cyclase domain-containing protein